LSFPAINRRKFIQLAAAAGTVALAADGFLLEPDRPRVVRQEILLRRWPALLDGFTIALLSDFHYDAIFSVHPIRAAIGMVNGLRPDLIALAGDFVSEPCFGPAAKGAQQAEPCAQLLRKLEAPHGLWAIMGNHDTSTDPRRVTGALRDVGIQVLVNQSVPIERNGGRFWLGGVNDAVEAQADLAGTLEKVPSGEATVLLAHEPDYADFVARHSVDLQLSGHSHGGQIRLPLVPMFYLPELAKKYIWGLYKIRELTLYTNPGLGTIGIPARVNCPPEITLLTMRHS
jgi:uncharacterized protein